jgi:DNA replication and repair protein RecF
MRVSRLWLSDFRSYADLELTLPPGLTAIVGQNGQGKTNILEAIGWLATMRSLRGATNDSLVRDGAATAIARAEVVVADRHTMIEAEIARVGRSRVLVNRQRLPRARDLLGHLRVTVFAPDDLGLVKGAPALRRSWLDDVLVAARPKNDRLCTDYDRILKQRNALLKQAGGRRTPDIESTLDVWDNKLAVTGDALGTERESVLDALSGLIGDAYRRIADTVPGRAEVTVRYDAPWRAEGLAEQLARSRTDDIRRATTTVGPHRDDVGLAVDDKAARTHRSQGEQRSLALALQLAAHRHVEAVTGTTPVLLLDDVFSELDEHRSRALLSELPAVQTLVTSAIGVPSGTRPELVVDVGDGRAVPRVLGGTP